jgi:rare lipoprotein A
LTASLLTACSATRWEEPTVKGSTAPANQDMTRTSRGNPPFYEVFGLRYIVMDSSENYREKGTASWYGKKFHGRQTSNGERYDMYRMTAAHKTLPLPTNVRVTNLSNGRSVVVRVNDRGPFVKNRLIDMSYAAAQQLDMINDGTAPVEVVALNTSYTGAITSAAAVSDKSAPQSVAHNNVPPSSMYIQVGAFGEADNARNLADKLTDRGIKDVSVHKADEMPELYRVRIGPFSRISDYDQVVAQVASLQITSTQLVVESPAATPQ